MFFIYALIATAIAAVLSARKRVKSLPAACPTPPEPSPPVPPAEPSPPVPPVDIEWSDDSDDESNMPPPAPLPPPLPPHSGLQVKKKRNPPISQDDANQWKMQRESTIPLPPASPVAAGFHISLAEIKGARKTLRRPQSIANAEPELVTGIRKVLENKHSQAVHVGVMVNQGTPVRQAAGWLNQHIDQ